MPDADELFRARGSWAERVLPPQTPAAAALAAAAAIDMNDLWRPGPEPAFVRTASGRFATRAPGQGLDSGLESGSSGSGSGSGFDSDALPAAASAGAPASSGGRLPRYSRGGKPAAKPAPAGVRPRHKARPMRQAVVSAVALGAIGAVAAAAAAMLGATSNPHSNTAALDGPQSGAPLGRATSPAESGAGRLTVSVTTGGGASVLGGTSGIAAGVVDSAVAVSSSGAASPTPTTTASSGAFYVSVNQRAADPDSVEILLRNAGTAPLNWSAAPSVSWLTLSRSSGTLAAGQSTMVTGTAGPGAPSALWSAQILFSPGGIVVNVHGGIPASGGGGAGSPTATPSGPTPSSPGSSPTPTPTQTSEPPTSSPSASPSTTTGTGTASGTPGGGSSQTPTTPAGGGTGGTGGGSGTPGPRPSIVGTPVRPAPGH